VGVEWLQVLTIVAALLGVVGVQTTWVIHALQRIETRLDGFEARVESRFAQVDSRFAQMEGRFSRIDERFDRIDGRFARLEQDVIRDHGQRISRLEARLE
jgi:tetrahydromethanopterin S-methyltransferase subunit G